MEFPGSKEAPDHDIKREGDDHVDRRSGQRNDQFLPWFVRHTLQPGNAADRKERNIRGVDPVGAGGQGMAEFVEDDTDKEKNDEGKPGKDRRQSTLCVVDRPEPGEEEEKGRVDADVDAGNAREVE